MTKGIDYEKKAGSGWLITGYVFAFLGGLIGFFIGLHLAYAKVRHGDGSILKKFDTSSRKNGNMIWILAIVAAVVWITLVNSENFSWSDF